MRLLLDTHALIWWLAANTSLSATARDAISDPDNDIFISAATAWEISTKYRIGKLTEASLLAADVAGFVAAQGFNELPITLRHGQIAGSLRPIHRDPFDRILVAQTVTENMTLVSNDAMLRAYAVALLW